MKGHEAGASRRQVSPRRRARGAAGRSVTVAASPAAPLPDPTPRPSHEAGSSPRRLRHERRGSAEPTCARLLDELHDCPAGRPALVAHGPPAAAACRRPIAAVTLLDATARLLCLDGTEARSGRAVLATARFSPRHGAAAAPLDVADRERRGALRRYELATRRCAVRAYAGVAVDGRWLPVGTVCTIDVRPRAAWPGRRRRPAEARHWSRPCSTRACASNAPACTRRACAAPAGPAPTGCGKATRRQADLGLGERRGAHRAASPGQQPRPRVGEFRRPPTTPTAPGWDAHVAARERPSAFRDAIARAATARAARCPIVDQRPAGIRRRRPFLGYRGAARDVTGRWRARRPTGAHRQDAAGRDRSHQRRGDDQRSDRPHRVQQPRPRRHVALPAGPSARAAWEALIRALAARGASIRISQGREEAFACASAIVIVKGVIGHELALRRPAAAGVRPAPARRQRRASRLRHHRAPQRRARAGRAGRLASCSALGCCALPDLWFVVDGEGRYLECQRPAHPLLARPLRANCAAGASRRSLRPSIAARCMGPGIRAALATDELQRIEYQLPPKTARSATSRPASPR